MLAVVAALTSVSAPVSAAPFEASADAELRDAADRARDQAIADARAAALEQAIASIDVAVDEAAVKAVLARPEAWTAAYRVLEVVERDATIEVRIEAEIDIPRLRKRIAASSGSTGGARGGGGARGFSLEGVEVRGCPAIDEAVLSQPLRAYGILTAEADSESSLSLTLECEDRGAVTHTHVRAAAVELHATTRGAVEIDVRVSSQGFSETIDAATQIALERGVTQLADELAVAARGDLELRVEQPWPAARVGVLERTLREAVMGVDAAELAGIAADGSALLRVGGRIDAKQLGRALQDLHFEGFSLVGLRIDGAHALRVRMQ